ncbi:MAG: TolC family outer membrane protein [Alphaproteobacteria bacterium]|nr:TolC family outer membrane protein [Alphaproteobacteria bacterium]
MSPLRFRLAVLPAAAALALAAPALAAADTLLEAMAKAYVANPQLEAERARLRAADEGVPQALSGWRPTVTARGSAGYGSYYTKRRRPPSSGTETRKPASVRLEATQPLYDGNRSAARLQAAKHRVSAQRARLVAVEQTVFLATGLAFMDVVRDQAVVELTVNNVSVLRRRLQAAEDQFEVGEVTRTDVAQAEARLARAIAERVSAEGRLETSRASYQRVVGELPGRLEAPPPLASLPGTKEEAVEAASQENPELAAATFEERAALEDAEAVRSELLPRVNLTGTVSHASDATGRGTRNNDVTVAATVSVPLYEAGSVTSRRRASIETASRFRAVREDRRRTAVEQAVRAWENLAAARARLESLTTEVRASEIALDGLQQEAEVGTRTLLDVLDAEQDLLDARVNVVRTKQAEAVASYQLAAAIGRLTVEVQKVPVPVYDFRANYDRVRALRWNPGAIFGGGGKSE